MSRPFQRLVFNFMYLFRPRWDTGIPAPELVRYIAGKAPGKAIDIGCGTGTNCLFLAQHQWAVTGIDFVPLAILKAKRKLAHFSKTLMVADVTQLCDLDLPGRYDLALDMGCFHSLAEIDRPRYVQGVEKWLKPQGIYMVYAFQPAENRGPRGISKEEMLVHFKSNFGLVNYEPGRGRASAWYYFERR